PVRSMAARRHAPWSWPRTSPRAASRPGGAAPLLTGAPALSTTCAGILLGRGGCFARGRIPLIVCGALLLLRSVGVTLGAVPLLQIHTVLLLLLLLLGRRGVPARRDGLVAGHRPVDLAGARGELDTGDPLDTEDCDDPDQGDHDREEHSAQDPAPTGRLSVCMVLGPVPDLAAPGLCGLLRPGGGARGRFRVRRPGRPTGGLRPLRLLGDRLQLRLAAVDGVGVEGQGGGGDDRGQGRPDHGPGDAQVPADHRGGGGRCATGPQARGRELLELQLGFVIGGPTAPRPSLRRPAGAVRTGAAGAGAGRALWRHILRLVIPEGRAGAVTN